MEVLLNISMFINSYKLKYILLPVFILELGLNYIETGKDDSEL
jgi:hypothetical protein